MKWVHYVLIIISWVTVPLLGKRSFWRFLPAATFISLLLSVESELAKANKWWKVNGKIVKNMSTAIGFVFGPYLVGSLWVLKWTYGRFSLYMLLNITVDALFSFVLSPLFEKFNVYKLKKFKQTTIFWNFVLFAVLMYGYQVQIEKGIQSKRMVEQKS